MAGPVVQVDASEVRRALRYIGDAGLKKQLRQANLDASQIVADEAKPNVPVRTGRLRASVRARASQREATVVAGGARVPYAAAIHWGRIRRGVIKARPFLTDAADRSQNRIVNAYLRSLDRLLATISRGDHG